MTGKEGRSISVGKSVMRLEDWRRSEDGGFSEVGDMMDGSLVKEEVSWPAAAAAAPCRSPLSKRT